MRDLEIINGKYIKKFENLVLGRINVNKFE